MPRISRGALLWSGPPTIGALSLAHITAPPSPAPPAIPDIAVEGITLSMELDCSKQSRLRIRGALVHFSPDSYVCISRSAQRTWVLERPGNKVSGPDLRGKNQMARAYCRFADGELLVEQPCQSH